MSLGKALFDARGSKRHPPGLLQGAQRATLRLGAKAIRGMPAEPVAAPAAVGRTSLLLERRKRRLALLNRDGPPSTNSSASRVMDFWRLR